VEKKISALVVDDSALMRNLISKMLESDPEIAVCATAMNGEFALEKSKKYSPDIIVLDLEMPVMNGIEFLKRKKEEGIETPVIILSSMAKKGAAITMEALSLGALDFILKPSGSVSRDIESVCEELVQMVKIYARKKDLLTGSLAAEEPEIEEKADLFASQLIEKQKKKGAIRIVAIGISTGGPNALRQILPCFDASFPVPIVIVQHMPAGFTEEFAKSLDRICPLEVKEAEDGYLSHQGTNIW
jgi:two-component system chemotaxis response regulator CheB